MDFTNGIGPKDFNIRGAQKESGKDDRIDLTRYMIAANKDFTIRNLRHSLTMECGRNEELKKGLEAARKETVKAETARTDAFIKLCDENNQLKEEYTKLFHENKELIESLDTSDQKPKNLTDGMISMFMQMQVDDMAQALRIHETQSKEKDHVLEVLRRSLKEFQEENDAIKKENAKLKSGAGKNITVNLTYTGADEFRDIINHLNKYL